MVFNVLAQYQSFLYWNSFQCSCTLSKDFCTGTVFNVLAQYQSFLHWNSFQCSCTVSMFLYWNSFQCSCTVSKFFTLEQLLKHIKVRFETCHSVYPNCTQMCQHITGILYVCIQQICKLSSLSSSEFKDVFQTGHIIISRYHNIWEIYTLLNKRLQYLHKLLQYVGLKKIGFD